MYSWVYVMVLACLLVVPGHAEGVPGSWHKIARHEQVLGDLGSELDTGGFLPESLLSADGAGSSKVSPEVKASAKAMAITIEDTMEQSVKSAHADTQIAVNDIIAKLDHATQEAVKAHAVAVESESAWVQCVETEKSLVEEAATATEQEVKLAAEMTLACDAKKEAQAALNLELMSQCSDCDTGSGSEKEALNTFRKLKAAKIGEAQELLSRKQMECSAKMSEHSVQLQEVSDKRVAYILHSLTCMDLSSSMLLTRCTFSEKYVTKCKKRSEYEALIKELDTPSGGVNSEFDRRRKWHSAQLIKCVLRKMQEGEELSKEVIASCEGGINYATDVGIIDKKEDEVARLTAEKNFTCQETDIVLNGSMYTIKPVTGGVQKPEDYTKDTNFKLPLLPEPRTTAFQSCAPPRGPTCKESITCPADSEDIQSDETCAQEPCKFTECCSTSITGEKMEQDEAKAVQVAHDKGLAEQAKTSSAAGDLGAKNASALQKSVAKPEGSGNKALTASEYPLLDLSWLHW